VRPNIRRDNNPLSLRNLAYDMGFPDDLTSRLAMRDKQRHLQRTKGVIYFVRCQEFVKIGYASDWRARVRSLAVSNPYRLSLLCLLKGGTDHEAELHSHFSEFRERGEWFRLSAEIMEFVSDALGEGDYWSG